MIYTDLAQETIDHIISTRLRTSDLDTALHAAFESLVKGLELERAVLWQLVLDRLVLTNQRSAQPDLAEIIGAEVNAKEATQIVLRFLCEFADESKPGIIAVKSSADEEDFEPLLRFSPDGCSSLVTPMRAQGLFRGFLVLEARTTKEWADSDLQTVEKVSAFLSTLLADSFEHSLSQREMVKNKTMVEVLSVFAEENDQAVAAWKAGLLIAECLGSKQSSVYLLGAGTETLVGQNDQLALTDSESPYVEVFNSGRTILIGREGSCSNSSYERHFGQHRGVVIPLIANHKTYGVLGLWQRSEKLKPHQPQDRQLASDLAHQLSKCLASKNS